MGVLSQVNGACLGLSEPVILGGLASRLLDTRALLNHVLLPGFCDWHALTATGCQVYQELLLLQCPAMPSTFSAICMGSLSISMCCLKNTFSEAKQAWNSSLVHGLFMQLFNSFSNKCLVDAYHEWKGIQKKNG